MSKPVFTITYWGVTGTLTAPLRPTEVTDKLVQAIASLVQQDKLNDLPQGPELEPAVRRLVEEHLPLHARSCYGGNTTCVEVKTPDALIVFDCGSGYRELGVDLERRWRAQGKQAVRAAHVLVTHSHMDHTYATPYFVPYYNRQNQFTIYGSKVSLDLVLPGGSKALRCTGRVKWTERLAGEERYLAGVLFTQLSEDQRRRIRAGIESLRKAGAALAAGEVRGSEEKRASRPAGRQGPASRGAPARP